MKLQKLWCLYGSLLVVPTILCISTVSRGETSEAQDRHQRLVAVEPVKVALLLPEPETQNWQSARRGAEIAIAEANENGGFHGRPFQLLVRSLTDPWGSGSREIASIVFDENVWAVLSWLDRRATHLAEQIVTKAQIALISARATDPTLTQINIPWFFNLMADDRQQAKVLVKEIVQIRELKRLAALTEDTFDSRMAADIFSQVVASEGLPAPLLFTYKEVKADFRKILRELKKNETECIVFFGQADAATDFIQLMRKQEMAYKVFGSMALPNSDFTLSQLSSLEGVVFIAPGHLMSSKGKIFQTMYLNACGYLPGVAAAYTYDGIGLIVAAIRQGGLSHEGIRDALKNINYHEGVTGPIRFDAQGKRQGPFNLIEIFKGRHRSLFPIKNPSL